MNSATSILPGARVRTREAIVGTVERLAYLDAEDDGQPASMLVRSEDGRWRYNLPLMLVREVTHGSFYTVVHLTIGPDEIVHYIVEEVRDETATTANAVSVESGEWAPGDDGAVLRLPLAAEELTVRKYPIELGMVHLHKGVETYEQEMTVPVYHEEAIVEHIAPDQYDAAAPAEPNEVIIPIVEERLVVEKRSFVKEYIRVRKNVVTDQQRVHDTLRREFVEVTERRSHGLEAVDGAPLVQTIAADSAYAATTNRPAP